MNNALNKLKEAVSKNTEVMQQLLKLFKLEGEDYEDLRRDFKGPEKTSGQTKE